MATNVTRGLDILVYVGDVAIGGQQNCSLSMEADTIDISNKNDFGWASFIGGAKSWTVSCDGQFITDDAGQKALMDAFIAGDNVTVEMKNEEATVFFGGEAAITSIELEASFDDVCTMSLELQGIGKLNTVKGE
jgi:TP901-1 family phage major tail protein